MNAVALPPTRVLIGVGVTLIAVVVLGVQALRGGDDQPEAGSADPTTTSVAPTTTPDQATTSSSIEILPDWYPKQSSRYSDRQPVVTVTTLAPTTTSDDDTEGDDTEGDDTSGGGTSDGTDGDT